MATKLRDVMTPDPLTLESQSTVKDAATAMAGADIGAVVVIADGGQVQGIVTDRDLVVRALAEGKDPTKTSLRDVCSGEITTLPPEASVEDAVKVMRERALRRVPVVEGGKTVGIVSLGDLAMERDPKSALADISAAPGNR